MIKPTYLKYMEHSHLFEDTAQVIELTEWEGKPALILDQTIFYPQGGGQPYDQGIIKTTDNSASFKVEEVRFKDGIVYHIGAVESGNFTPNMNVELSIDKDRRRYNSRNHTGAHIIDTAMRILGYELPPHRGYHFPVGSYVEYVGTLEEQERNELLPKLQTKVDELIKQNLPVEIKMVTLDELKAMASFVPDFIPKDKPTRAMIITNYPAIPCGGTHAQNTGEVAHVIVEKIKNKKGNLRISYSVD
jgi:Ser-tRNA(Ala) deacylase AlaX